MILLGRRRIAYVPIPKNASSSVMHWLFEFEHGVPPGPKQVHQHWPCKANGGSWLPPADAYLSFVVLRDPLERFMSGYNNRVVERGDLKREAPRVPRLRRLGLSLEPGINEFVRRLPRYIRYWPSIAYHFTPQWNYLYAIAHRLNRLYAPDELADLYDEIRAWCDADPGPPPHVHAGMSAVDARRSLDDASMHRLGRFYRRDFKFVPEALARSRAAATVASADRIQHARR